MIFCDREEDLRRVDGAMNQMTRLPAPAPGGSVETYEVGLNEQP